MAKIRLNHGEKLQITNKTYRVISEGLDIPQVFGKLTFRGIEGTDTIKITTRQTGGLNKGYKPTSPASA